MSAVDIVGVAGIVLAVLGIVISIYYGRKALYPAGLEIQWFVETSRLIPDDIDAHMAEVEVRINDRAIANPHFTRLSLKNCGKRDVESTMFDQGRPIVFSLAEVTSFYVLSSGDTPVASVAANVRIGPELLPSGAIWKIAMLTDGAPDITLEEQHLTNTKITYVAAPTGSFISNAAALYERIAVTASSVGAIGAIAAIISLLSQ